MTTQKHTSGPWEIRASYRKHEFHIVGPKDEAICATHPWLDSDPEDESRANAHLIAAAPDLLAALKDLISSPNITQCPGGKWSTADCSNYVLVRAAEKAIDKAS